MSSTQGKPHNLRYTREAANVATGSDVTSAQFDAGLLEFQETGRFFDLLREQDFSLAVTREYEHFLLCLDGTEKGPHQSAFPLPHPSGFWFDETSRELIVSSTRTPNIVVWLSPFRPAEDVMSMSITPLDFTPPGDGDGVLFLPRKARYLPGSFYIHDLVKMGPDIFATVTGHNFLARLSLDAGWEPAWWPQIIDGCGDAGFRTNFLQLNSIAANGTPDKSFYTGFSNLVSGAKPWKQGYGPIEKGVVFSGETRAPITTGLTCPHSARLADGKLWVCNSGYGTYGYVDNYESLDPSATKFVPVGKAPGFTRGMAFGGDYVFVGLSVVIPEYEPYAPGIEPEESKNGIWVFDRRTGETVATLVWPNGYQIYDVQILPGIKKPVLPLATRDGDGINPLLRFLG